MSERAFVVGVAGVPGAGKTTLTGLLLRRLSNARPVYYDQHQTITRMSTEQIHDWFRRGGDPNEFALAELVDDLTRKTAIRAAERSRPVVIFETPFGRLHRASGRFIDFLVWIDAPLDIALARATLAFLKSVEGDNSPSAARDFVRWQKQYMLNYPIVRPLYVAQSQVISAQADLVLDGSKGSQEAADAVLAALRKHGLAV